MTFTVAHDISKLKIIDMKLEEGIVKKLAINSDFKLALDFIKEINLLKRLQFAGEVDLTKTTLLYDRIDGWFKYFSRLQKDIFIDNKMNDIFSTVFNKYDIYMKSFEELTTETLKTKFVLYEEINFITETYEVNLINHGDENKLYELFKAFLASCSKFEEYVFNRKNEFIKNEI